MRPPANRDLHELPKFRDGLSYLYVEHAVIEQEAMGIAVYNESGSALVPVAALATLMLGPGTKVTHAAMKALADNGVTTLWVGEEMTRCYCSGMGETRSSHNLLKQAEAWANPETHLKVVVRMYQKRFAEMLPDDLNLRQIRGREGVRVRETYAHWSRVTGVPWNGREYDRKEWSQADPINRALSCGASLLYGISHSAILSSGFSPGIGFIHSGKQLSFVYDVADLYKAEILIPSAFQAVAEDHRNAEQLTRMRMRILFKETRLLEKIVDDIENLFEGLASADSGDTECYLSDAAPPGKLWDPNGDVSGGVSYDGNDIGESSKEPAGTVDKVANGD